MYGDSFPMLNNMKVIELDGYLPVRFFGKTLLDFGADGLKVLYKIIEKADVLLDCQKKGFLEKLNINKDELIKKFPKLILIFLSGYGIAENNSKIPVELTNNEITKYSSVNSLKKILEFFKNKENLNNKYINPLIILGDLFGGCIMPLYELSQAIIDRRKSGQGNVLNSVITANLFSLSIISDKLRDSNKFHFSCNTKNLDYVLFSIDLTQARSIISAASNKQEREREKAVSDKRTVINSEKLNINNKPDDTKIQLQDKNNRNNNDLNSDNIHNEKYNFIIAYNQNSEHLNYLLKKICERLLVEVLNLQELPEGLRLNLTRDYIDYFQLITKSLNDSVKYIKDLCKLLEKEEILKQLKKFEFLGMYPVIQFNELIQYFKYSNILKGDNIIKSFTDEQPLKDSNAIIKSANAASKKSNVTSDNEKNGNNFFEDTVIVNLKSNLNVFGINEKDLTENNLLLDRSNKNDFKPKL